MQGQLVMLNPHYFRRNPLANEQDTLRDILTAQARRLEKQTFLEYADQHFSFAAVDDRTDRVAHSVYRVCSTRLSSDNEFPPGPGP